MKLPMMFLPLMLVGCIHTPTMSSNLGLAPGAAAPTWTPAQISACESTRSWHNIWTLGALFLSGAAGVQGATEAGVTGNKDAEIGLGIGSASAAALALVATAAAGMEADNYSMANCSAVL